MPCMTGSGAQFNIVYTQSVHPKRYTDMNTIISGLDIETLGNWRASIPELRKPQVKAGWDTGSETFPVVNYCPGGALEHENFTVSFYHTPAWNKVQLAGKLGTVQRYHQDGSVWQGVGFVGEVDGMPTEEVNELSMGELTVRFTQGAEHTPVGGGS